MTVDIKIGDKFPTWEVDRYTKERKMEIVVGETSRSWIVADVRYSECSWAHRKVKKSDPFGRNGLITQQHIDDAAFVQRNAKAVRDVFSFGCHCTKDQLESIMKILGIEDSK